MSDDISPLAALGAENERLRAENERLRDEVATLRHPDEYRAFLENTTDLMTIVDDQGRFTYANEACEAAFGLPTAQLAGKLAFDFVHPDDRKATQAAFSGWVQRRVRSASFENRQVARDGTVRMFLWTVMPRYGPRGEVQSVWSIARDITELREAEETLEAHRDQLETEVAARTSALRAKTRELELSNRELNAFAYSVSHDLRAPLRAVAGFAHALLEDYHDQLDAVGQDYLRRCSDAARRMGQLIDDLLTLSRITRSEMRPAQVDLSELAGEIVAELRSDDPSRDVEVVVRPGISVWGDRHLRRHALGNLLDNAWKFTSRTPGARVEIGTRARDGGKAVFVEDNGAGFDMAYADNLFTPFHRLHKENDFPGTGIGLSIVRRVVRMHGGTIRAESAPGSGATFFFDLALEPPDGPPEEAS